MILHHQYDEDAVMMSMEISNDATYHELFEKFIKFSVTIGYHPETIAVTVANFCIEDI